MKVCDLTQFYSPVSGGVKRYVREKIRYLQESERGDQHLLIIPGERDERIVEGCSTLYTIASPLLSKKSGYRALIRLERLEAIVEAERPDVIESGDPYQVAWRAVRIGQRLQIPVVGFYHSHFPEAYLRGVAKYLGRTGLEWAMDGARRYVCATYNRFERTLVPSPALCDLLTGWGVNNALPVDLGFDPEHFRPVPDDRAATREALGLPSQGTLCLYIGRLALEKNTRTLFEAFTRLHREEPGRFHLVVLGDGLQRPLLEALQRATGAVTWLPYCDEAAPLARIYRAADLFVHPGVQETFGLVALEAQACGTPVVGIRGSYLDRIIQSDQTLWAEVNTPEALAGAIRATAATDLRAVGAAASQAVRERYGWPRVFERLLEIYEQAIATYNATHVPAQHRNPPL